MAAITYGKLNAGGISIKGYLEALGSPVLSGSLLERMESAFSLRRELSLLRTSAEHEVHDGFHD